MNIDQDMIYAISDTYKEVHGRRPVAAVFGVAQLAHLTVNQGAAILANLERDAAANAEAEDEDAMWARINADFERREMEETIMELRRDDDGYYA